MLLATWLSPAFPIGGFSYSHGLETVITDGTIADASSLEDWIGFLIERGSGWTDAVLLAEAWRSVSAQDEARFAEVTELAAALAPSRERQMETLNLGDAFLLAASAGWPSDLIDRFKSAADRIAYPVAVGLTAAAQAIPLKPTLAGFLNSFAGNMISVAVRLVPLGQSDGLARSRPAAAADPRHRRTCGGIERLTISVRRPSSRTSPPCVTRRSIHGCSAHDDFAQRPAPRRHRRPGRRRQDDPHRGAVQGAARPLFGRRRHQRHLHQGRRADPQPRPGAARRSASSASRPAAVRTPRSARTPRSISPRSPK